MLISMLVLLLLWQPESGYCFFLVVLCCAFALWGLFCQWHLFVDAVVWMCLLAYLLVCLFGVVVFLGCCCCCHSSYWFLCL